MKKVCVFVDGENFRRSLVNLFKPKITSATYLPETAKWAAFFDWLVTQSVKQDCERIRTYWYVVAGVYSFPYLPDPRRDKQRFCDTYQNLGGYIDNSNNSISDLFELRRKALDRGKEVKKRSESWAKTQERIMFLNRQVEFRQAGVLKHNLITNDFTEEKGVDVNLATDLLHLKDIYDIALIVSGDQDFIPAVRKVKDYGKLVVNVAFQKEDGKLLPGGAKKLNEVTDWNYNIAYGSLKTFILNSAMTELEGFEAV